METNWNQLVTNAHKKVNEIKNRQPFEKALIEEIDSDNDELYHITFIFILDKGWQVSSIHNAEISNFFTEHEKVRLENESFVREFIKYETKRVYLTAAMSDPKYKEVYLTGLAHCRWIIPGKKDYQYGYLDIEKLVRV